MVDIEIGNIIDIKSERVVIDIETVAVILKMVLIISVDIYMILGMIILMILNIILIKRVVLGLGLVRVVLVLLLDDVVVDLHDLLQIDLLGGVDQLLSLVVVRAMGQGTTEFVSFVTDALQIVHHPSQLQHVVLDLVHQLFRVLRVRIYLFVVVVRNYVITMLLILMLIYQLSIHHCLFIYIAHIHVA